MKYLAHLGVGSRRTMKQALASIASLVAGAKTNPAVFAWERLSRTDTLSIRKELLERFSSATANKMLSALRGVLREARAMGLMAEPDYVAVSDLEYIPSEPSRASKFLTPAEIRLIFRSCEQDPGAAGRRDSALLALFLSSGMRRAEAVALDVADFDRTKGALRIRSEEPRKSRTVLLGAAARAAMADWLSIRGVSVGPLFLPVSKGGNIQRRRLTDQAIYDIVRGRAKDAGLPHVTTRELRRRYVVGLIAAGHDLDDVQALVGHASWITTAAYRKLAAESKREAVGVLNIPYRGHRARAQ